MSSIKTYKNPLRAQVDQHKKYVPQYVQEGIEPEEYKSSIVPDNLPKAKPTADNPRAKRAVIQQPYAAVVPAPTGKGYLPNSGNNVENSWFGVVEDDISDEDIDPNHPMIDNNDLYQDPNLSLDHEKEDNITISILEDLQENDYLLLIKSEPFCSGSLEDVQSQAGTLAFDQDINISDMIIIKRVPIKIGLFLER